ncbi:MAG: 16S rRNA processing protein RimM [Spirochaetes bacterium]|nr:16S rRNA processing protein RimM [Spirochaetota bacterium]
MADEYIRIAVVAGVHGLNGRLRIAVVTDVIGRFENDKKVFIQQDNAFRKYTIAGFIPQKDKSGLLKLDGIDDRDSALAFRGLDIFIEKSEAEKTRSELGEESFYYYDIIGCEVYYNGRRFGTVRDILEAGAGEVLIIADDRGKTFMVPFVKAMVDTGEIRSGRLDIHPVEGLIDF